MDTNISIIIIYNAPAMQLMYISGSLPLAIIDKFNAFFFSYCMHAIINNMWLYLFLISKSNNNSIYVIILLK